nr:hypothetical protein [Tanacetum cinerariifolium]
MTEVIVGREDTVHGISAHHITLQPKFYSYKNLSVMTNKEYHTQIEEQFYNVQNKLEALRAESARKHEELIDPLKKYAISIDCDDGSRKKEQLVVPCSDEEIVKSPTQHAITEKNSEYGGNLKDLILTSVVDKGDFTRLILTGKEDVGQKLIDDLDGPLIVLESYEMINKNKFADGDVAPVAAVAPVEQSSLSAGKNQAKSSRTS